MAVSIHDSLDLDSKRMSTRRSSSILPHFEETRNVVGNFTTKFSMSSFVKRVEELTHDQKIAIERVGFGNLLRVHHHTLRKNLLVEWMERWNCDKRAFLLHDREITITSVDTALILGLRATGRLVSLSEEDPLSELEKEYGATSSNRKISISLIEQRLQSLGDIANEDFVRTFLLFIFGTLLFPSSNAKVDSRYLSFLRDLNEVSEYNWSMAVVEDLFNWLSRRKEEHTKGMEGCLILLQIWSFEHIDIGRPNLLSCSVDFPRACRWESSRCNSPRHWFTTKFNELEDNQVTWKLQLTATELNIDIIRELLMEETMGEAILSTRTNTTTSKTLEVPSSSFCQNAALDDEPKGGVGRGKHELQAIIPEDSGGSSEISSLVEEIERDEVLSTKTITTSGAIGLPPKSYTQPAILDKEPDTGLGRSKHDTQADIPEDSRQLTDVSVITEDYAECSSTYGLQGDQIAETSHYVKGECVLENEKSNDVDELKKEIVMLRKQLSLIPKLEVVIENLRKEVAELKEDNQRLRAPPPADNIERFIDAYFDGVSDASDVFCF